MTGSYDLLDMSLGAILVVGLFGYLLTVLVRPEKF